MRYFALFYVLGLVLMALFIRFYLWKKRQQKIKKEESTTPFKK
jgi:Flp pilus assembly protein TadB